MLLDCCNRCSSLINITQRMSLRITNFKEYVFPGILTAINSFTNTIIFNVVCKENKSNKNTDVNKKI